MADDQGGNDQDKTEDPTPKRRQEAREEGNIAKSQDLSAAVILLCFPMLLWLLGPLLLSSLSDITRAFLGPELGKVTTSDLDIALTQVGLKLLWGVVPLFLIVAAIAFVANVLQVGFLFAPKKLQWSANGLNPINGFKRMFFEPKPYVGCVMNTGKMILAGGVAYWAVKSEVGNMVALQGIAFPAVIAAGAGVVFGIILKVAAVLLVLAVADFAYQRYNHEQKLKMTKQQVKDEMKRMEGDPQIKMRRRQIAMQRAMNRIRTDVPQADVIVTNPTHFAVALKYDEHAMNAPKVVAKGGDHLAFKIREIAQQHGVPIVERPPLARALYGGVEVGQEIPEDFYAVVAELLAYVYQLDRAAGAYKHIPTQAQEAQPVG